jgi:tRNA(Ile)-lysidine synthase
MNINNVDVILEYDRLVFSKRWTIHPDDLNTSPFREVGLGLPGDVVWPLTGQRMMVSMNHSAGMVSQSDKLEMHLDADTFTPELRLRSWKAGDVFCPKGFGGRKKKLQDFFSDMKLPRSQRAKVPLLVAPEGILWVGGLREDERFQVSTTTRSIVTATLTF